jgi:RsmE family RNA methyltransferase
VRLSGRRLQHVSTVHRAAVGDALVVGVANARVGIGTVLRIDAEMLEMDVALDRDPPAALPLTLVLALPRPKVLNRVIASATSLGIKRIVLINAWRVEKSYWKSPRLSEENLRHQSILGLEQARDTVLPSIETRRFFRAFVERPRHARPRRAPARARALPARRSRASHPRRRPRGRFHRRRDRVAGTCWMRSGDDRGEDPAG